MLKNAYWFIPIVLLFFQAVYTFSSMNQIRVEELNDSVRDVYWLEHKVLFTYRPKNLGWYAPLLLIYKGFGFQLFTAKFFKLFLDGLSLYCLAFLLRKFLGIKKALIPLITLGLSPTILYYTMLQIPVGIDFQYLPICLYFLVTLNFKNRFASLLKQFIIWVVMLVAISSYPPFLFYMPGLVVFYLSVLFKQVKSTQIRIQNLMFAALGWVIPFLSLFFYMEDKKALFSPEGIINGTANQKFGIQIFIDHFNAFLGNLFISANNGYYYEVFLVEFSHILPIITWIIVFFTTFKLLKAREFKLPIFLVLITMILNTLVSSMTTDIEVGLRRFTPVVASFYFLYVFAYFYAFKQKKTVKKYLLIVSLLILPLHHILVYKPNLDFFVATRHFAERFWFVKADSPVKSLESYTEQLQKQDLDVTCLNEKGEPTFCRYDILFSAVEGYCTWNNIVCHNLNAFDPKTGKMKILSINSGI